MFVCINFFLIAAIGGTDQKEESWFLYKKNKHILVYLEFVVENFLINLVCGYYVKISCALSATGLCLFGYFYKKKMPNAFPLPSMIKINRQGQCRWYSLFHCWTTFHRMSIAKDCSLASVALVDMTESLMGTLEHIAGPSFPGEKYEKYRMYCIVGQRECPHPQKEEIFSVDDQ